MATEIFKNSNRPLNLATSSFVSRNLTHLTSQISGLRFPVPAASLKRRYSFFYAYSFLFLTIHVLFIKRKTTYQLTEKLAKSTKCDIGSLKAKKKEKKSVLGSLDINGNSRTVIRPLQIVPTSTTCVVGTNITLS